MRLEALEPIPGGPAGLKVLPRRQQLADIAPEPRAALAVRPPVRRPEALHPRQDRQRGHGVHEEEHAQARILDGHGHQDADQHQRRGDDAHDQIGEEKRQRLHIAIHALDQLTGRVRLVEVQVEAHQMRDEVLAQRIARRPGHLR